jgi:WD40 repeat protein
MMPYRMLGYAGYHTLPFERISLSPSKDLIASTSHDSQLRFWNVSRFNDIPQTTSDGSDDSEGEEEETRPGRGGKRKNNSLKMPKRRKQPTGNDFFSDL